MTQGGRANSSGNVLETTIEGTLIGHGYSAIGCNVPKKQRLGFLLSPSNNFQKRYARQVYIGQGIYDTDIYVDFYVIGSSISSGLIIECKWQQSGGSVDEKLPYLNLNIQYCYPVPAIVLIDGGGMKPKAVTWLSTQTVLNQNLLAVHNLTSFIKWSNNNF
ncbi:PD-(D/E)XK nuclease superfamily protein [Synechocystis sp. PCC 7509]|uniref:PD-(D/E)XK nuclease superfamily protein n=1 Tax=Synechocystis sp. PCC 7509 TaxID=927677 RepID=UPI0002ACF2F3|nr:PD-(D/E)XK nuclease superfamily protein [Synechocystis sp. PCC 7509]